ncbi:hypothetical protein ACVWYG_003057 [Pedobacter sp. UYEF25]
MKNLLFVLFSDAYSNIYHFLLKLIYSLAEI